jgi:myo-inositol-1-phosphate synthase
MPIRVAIIGLGNCANTLIQGLEYYRSVTDEAGPIPGVMHNSFGGYLIKDIAISCVFDINAQKVGKDVAEAMWVHPTNSRKFCSVPHLGVKVSPGGLLDGLAPHMAGYFPVAESPFEEVVSTLKKSGAEMCVSFLPVGSRKATEFYAEACLAAGVAFINGIPEFVASDPNWEKRFRDAGLPCAGDDIQSQVGATIIHRTLVNLVRERGLKIVDSYQLDIGGNMDFDNLTDRSRLSSKRVSKTAPVIEDAGTDNVKVVPADYIPFLGDNKIAYINIRGIQFGNFPMELELKMSVEDSPNNAGVMIDAIRAMKLSLDRKLTGYQEWSAYYFKHPLRHHTLEEARQIVRSFLGLNR